jgi:hypothetical protein
MDPLRRKKKQENAFENKREKDISLIRLDMSSSQSYYVAWRPAGAYGQESGLELVVPPHLVLCDTKQDDIIPDQRSCIPIRLCPAVSKPVITSSY